MQALRSVARQTRPPERVVVVDDGSTDETPTRVQAWLAEHGRPGWELLRGPQRGAAAARNAGAALCPECDYLAFLDSDDEWPADFLQRATAALDAEPDAVAVTADRAERAPGTGTGGGGRQVESAAEWARDPIASMFERGAGVGSATLLRCSAFDAAGGYPTAYRTGHDTVLYARLCRRGAWLPLAGAPVEFRRAARADGDGMDHLWRTVGRPYLRWALLHQHVHAELTADGYDVRGLRGARARRWAHAAREASGAGRPRTARACARRALGLRPFSRRAWSLWLRTRRSAR
jgi:glycosyltransferase involved in cell wall biosynthesis